MKKILNMPAVKSGAADRKLSVKVYMYHMFLSRFIPIMCNHAKETDLLYP